MSDGGRWRKSSSSGAANACVEVRVGRGATGIRDSKCPSAGALAFPADAVAAFLARVRT